MMRLHRALPLIAIALGAIGCARQLPEDAIRTPLWMDGGEAMVHARQHVSRFGGGPLRHDLWLADRHGRRVRRLAKRVAPAGLHDNARSGDGRSLVCATGNDARQDLVLVDLLTGDRQRLVRGTPLRPQTLCWDPLGRGVAVSRADVDAIIFVDVGTRRRHQIASQAPLVCDWMPDGRLLLATDHPAAERNSLGLWMPGSQSAPEQIFRTPRGGTIHSARADARGEWIAALIHDVPEVGHQLALIEVATGNPDIVWESPRPLVGLRWAPDGDALFVSQLGRGRHSGWQLNRLDLADRRPVAVAEHWGGWDITPDGGRLALAVEMGDQVEVRALFDE